MTALRTYCGGGAAGRECEECLSACLAEVKKKRRGEKEAARLTLDRLEPGQRGRIVKIRRRGALGRRITDMGVTPGTLVEVERVAPLGDPIKIKLKGYRLSLRKGEASEITVTLL